MNALGAEGTPKIVVLTQPAQSPDMNVNDLALFRSLDVRVRKLRRGSGCMFDPEKLVSDVLQAVEEYPAETLVKIWGTKTEIMGKIVLRAGGNDYERHRIVVVE